MENRPTLFISHGAPNTVLHDNPARRSWDSLTETMTRPTAIVVASAHYNASHTKITTAAWPKTIHDFSGFESELYQIEYRAPGAPELADTMMRRLMAAGFQAELDSEWGFDHGTWVPLMRLFPNADIPVVAISVNPSANARTHVELGRALAPLREDGVLFLGSGSYTHNLSELLPPESNDACPAWVSTFRDWMNEKIAAGDERTLCNYFEQAPNATRNHPSTEHLLPLFFAMGAAGEAWQASHLHQSTTYGTLAMDVFEFNS